MTCDSCGAKLSAEMSDCKNLFDEVLARDFSDIQYFRTHRLLVDAYSLQHPATYMRSGKSFAAHLTGMCVALEYEASAGVNRALQQWLNGARKIEKPAQIPSFKGNLTVLHVYHASDAKDHNARLRTWAHDVWSAWSAHHELAREWIKRAMF